MNNKKTTWSYYTPSWLSDFIVRYVQDNIKIEKKINVLEPSCWDGVFVESLNKYDISRKINKFTLSDINEDALNKASSFSWSYKIEKHLWDFLKVELKNEYSLIIWNPPYIHKKYLSDEQKESCLYWYKEAGIHNKRVLNIWPSFIYKSTFLLKDDGVLVFVIPEELVRVNYASDTLKFLKNSFDRLEIYSLDKVIFWDAWQNTIVLFAYKKHLKKWTYSWQIFLDWDKKDNLRYKNHFLSDKNFHHLDQKELWTELGSDELGLINEVTNTRGISIIWDISESQTWIVTWANDFFIISEDKMIEYNLEDFCKPIIRKWYYTRDNLKFTKTDFKKTVLEWKPSYLLEIKWDIKNKNLQEYINILIKEWINKRYKVWTYKPNWYNIPNIWGSKLIFFKRSHIAPKLVYNPSEINVTDSWYRVTLKNGKYKEFQYCFYNSFTLLMMELWWRTYGWWVLEVTPNEFKKLPIPFFEDVPTEKLDIFYKKNLSSIEDILIENDKYILWTRLWIPTSTIKKIQKIRRVLLDKRLNKKNILK